MTATIRLDRREAPAGARTAGVDPAARAGVAALTTP